MSAFDLFVADTRPFDGDPIAPPRVGGAAVCALLAVGAVQVAKAVAGAAVCALSATGTLTIPKPVSGAAMCALTASGTVAIPAPTAPIAARVDRVFDGFAFDALAFDAPPRAAITLGARVSGTATLALTATGHVGRQFFVSPTGGTGAGTLADPWSLAHAITGAGGAVTPGSTVWILKDADYTAPEIFYPEFGWTDRRMIITANGTSTLPVTFSSVSREPALMARLKASVIVRGAHVRLRSLDCGWDYDTDRRSNSGGSPVLDVPRQSSGIASEAVGTIVENCLVHDCGGGISGFNPASGLTTYDCIIWNNGWRGTDRGHGHGYYLQNTAANARKQLHNTISFHNYGGGIKFAGSDNNSSLVGLTMTGPIAFDNGLPSFNTFGFLNLYNFGVDGGQTRKGNITATDASFYYRATPSSESVRFGDDQGGSFPSAFTRVRCQGRMTIGLFDAFTMTDSMLTAGSDVIEWTLGRSLLYVNDVPVPSSRYTLQRNRYVHDGDPRVLRWSGNMRNLTTWRSDTGWDSDSQQLAVLTAPEVQLTPSAVEAGRAHLAVWNPTGASSVNVDLSSILTVGQFYRIDHVFDFVTGGAATVQGTFTGAPVALPMVTKTGPQPQGEPDPLPASDNLFGAFVVRRVDALPAARVSGSAALTVAATGRVRGTSRVAGAAALSLTATGTITRTPARVTGAATMAVSATGTVTLGGAFLDAPRATVTLSMRYRAQVRFT